ncbi:MAG TPA: hypothetical protein VJ851_04200 [Jatrophihabitans sp.]|nr:hypothetical protein [Jatrophihabitans sp.]
MARRIIAVFGPSGSNPYAVTAKSLGRQIAQHHILLSGGSGKPDGSVKESALAGAEEALQMGGEGGWIAVPKAGAPVTVPRHRRGFVLANDYRDERNFINALVCQSAIALKGGPGTDSEVAFALALGRPVILLGPGWEGLAALPDLPESGAATLVSMIDQLFGPPKTPVNAVERAIVDARQTLRELKVFDVRTMPDLHADAARIVDIAAGCASALCLDQLGQLVGSATSVRFRSWLASS